MTPQQYLLECARTDHSDYLDVQNRLNNDEVARLTHYALGLSSEAGEVCNALKRHVGYGLPLDKVNLKEELSDCLYYIARICSTFDWSLEEVMDANIAKLRAKFPQGFEVEKVLSRNVQKERDAMELK